MLVRKVAFPRLILPLAAVAAQFVQFALMYVVIVPLLLVFGAVSPALVGLIPVILLQVIFTAGLGLLLSTAYVYARDTRHLLEVGLQVWFWMTPVVYSVAMIPERARGCSRSIRWPISSASNHAACLEGSWATAQQWPAPPRRGDRARGGTVFASRRRFAAML